MDDYVTYLILSTDTTDPESIKEALNRRFPKDRDRWIKAMKEERDSLAKNGTWTLVDLPKNKRALDTK